MRLASRHLLLTVFPYTVHGSGRTENATGRKDGLGVMNLSTNPRIP